MIPDHLVSSTTMENTIDEDDKKGDDSKALCASCDRCRSRKTKCDGKRPCSNCIAKYMKKYKVTSVEGVPAENFECIYSLAKRRGPIPGRTNVTSRRNSDGNISNSDDSEVERHDGPQIQTKRSIQSMGNTEWIQPAAGDGILSQQSGLIDPQIAAFLQSHQKDNIDATGVGNNIQQQISFLQQQIQQQQQQMQQQGRSGDSQASEGTDDRGSRRMKVDDSSQNNVSGGVPRTIISHTHLLDRSDPEGSRLRAYYKLSIDELFCLPPTPSDDEYCTRLNIPGLTPSMIPGTHLAALSAARFVEAALGALVHNEVSLAMELCNAVVHCLRESVQEPVQTPVIFEVAKAYFLLGIFRAFRGDMQRYFKYRRVCLTYLSKLEGSADTQTLLASISYLDSWAYMIYNADEKALPDVDDTIPGPQQQPTMLSNGNTENERKYSIKTDLHSIACDPKNKNWIQGAPAVYLNNEAPLRARVLDALACSVRTCCDQANGRFATISSEVGDSDNFPACVIPRETIITPTTTAVLAHENELCSRNLVLTAFALMQQHDNNSKGHTRNSGQHLIISAMDAFLENSDESGSGGFSDSQIQSLLSVCNTAIENPFILHHAGPTAHMVSNAAILLAHFLNGMHAMSASHQSGSMEAVMFDEVVDTFTAIRKLLTIHRRKLPVKLRCHGIPRPNFKAQPGQPFVDLGETLLCVCRGCQGFVLMACSPCVAAERARSASARLEVAAAQEAEAFEMGEISGDFLDFGSEFNIDDDALLGVISSLISS